jgi:hypothetical protein
MRLATNSGRVPKIAKTLAATQSPAILCAGFGFTTCYKADPKDTSAFTVLEAPMQRDAGTS